MTSRRRRDAGGTSAAGSRLTPAGGQLPRSNRQPRPRQRRRLLSAIEVHLVLSRQVRDLAVLALAPLIFPFSLPWLLFLQNLLLLHLQVTLGLSLGEAGQSETRDESRAQMIVRLSY